jgi:hypothetical protein
MAMQFALGKKKSKILEYKTSLMKLRQESSLKGTAIS